LLVGAIARRFVRRLPGGFVGALLWGKDKGGWRDPLIDPLDGIR